MSELEKKVLSDEEMENVNGGIVLPDPYFDFDYVEPGHDPDIDEK